MISTGKRRPVGAALLRIDVMPRADSITAVLKGEVDLSTVSQLDEVFTSAGERAVELDMRDVAYLDSSGLTVLLRRWQQGGRIRIVEPSPIVLRLLDVTGLTKIFVV